MRYIRPAGLALLVLVLFLLALRACGTFSDDAWLSEQTPHRPEVVLAPVPQDTTGSSRGTFTSVSVGGSHICGVQEDGSVDCTTLEDPDRENPLTLEAPAGQFTSVSVGSLSGDACGVRVDGVVACWDTTGGQTAPAGRFRSVSVGFLNACGVREDGSVACWGDDTDRKATPPRGAFTSVSTGNYHTCGVREDGSIACWGDNTDPQATPPRGAFTSVSTGDIHACGVREDGSIACWGDNSYGQATPPEGRFRSVTAGEYYTCGVREDGSIACWGEDEHAGHALAAPPGGAFTSVSIGSYSDNDYSRYHYACGLRVDGSVACWGGARHFSRLALSITDRTSSSLTIEWSDPSETGVFNYFQVHVSRSPEGPYSLVTSGFDEGSHVHTGLEPDGVYYFVVLGCDSLVCSSETAVATTESVGPVSVPATPTGFRGKKAGSNVFSEDARLTWNAVEEATYYELWKGSHPDSSFELLVYVNAPLDAQSFDIDPNRGLLGLYRTSWKVRACNKAGCSPFTDVVTVE